MKYIKIFKIFLYFFTTIHCFGEHSLNWNASEYHKHARRQNTIASNALDYLTLQGNETILDVGCGDGTLSVQIAQLVPNGFVYATDISNSMIQFAKKEFGYIKNIKFEQMDATRISFENEFDLVVSFFCFHWIEKKETALQRMVNAVKKDGILFILATSDDEQPLVTAYKSAMHKSFWQSFFAQYQWPLHLANSQECQNQLQNFSCTILNCIKIKKFNIFISYDQFKHHLEALPLGIDCLPKNLQSSFLNDVIDEYLKLYPANEDGSINYLCPYYIIYAKKR